MTSFYARTPSSFMVECGWGGREIDPRPGSLRTKGRPEPVGPERGWLPREDREKAREMRMRLAAAGIRVPVQVIEGNYRLSGICAWWDSVK